MSTTTNFPLTERKYLAPFILITSLFFLWAFGVNLNDVLIPHFKKAFQLTDLQSSLIQAAFFGGYFLAALPAGWLMERIGYKKGILSGLMICATGALLFIPSANALSYGFFLFALFVMACGQSFLEVAANPYVTILGPQESSERRLNLAQSFNSVGAVATPYIGAAFILTNTRPGAAAAEEVHNVIGPYLVIAAVFVLVAVMIALTALPETKREVVGESGTHPKLRDALRHKHLAKGVIAQFAYVGAQVGVGSFIIRFSERMVPGLQDKDASIYLQYHWIGFMIGRFAGSFLMKYVAASRMLSLFAGSAFVCACLAMFASGTVPVWGLVLIGFFHSIMFPTIFALGIKGLGPYTKLGSSLLVMAIIGGAVFPALMGYVSDLTNIRIAFGLPLLCYLYIWYYAAKGSRPEMVEPEAKAA
jgi:FHS family L-fucose permease-like MFS transporter